ncbi:MAG TPA: hypothetical protein PKC97_05635 [Burkholderiaceae bacterium]|nr:hypothetical protein [Burkholderiaceae bacterium]
MNFIQLHPFAIRRTLVAVASAACLAPSLAAASHPSASSSLAEAEQAYVQQRAACLSGDTSQSRKDCLRDAGAALQMARKSGGSMPTVDAQTLADNAMLRCTALPAGDRFGCEQIVKGNGMHSGNGIREYVRTVPAQ